MAEAWGRGGQALVIAASGMSSHTVWKAAKEVREGRWWRPGSGPPVVVTDRLSLLADDTGLEDTVCHFSPGTSK